MRHVLSTKGLEIDGVPSTFSKACTADIHMPALTINVACLLCSNGQPLMSDTRDTTVSVASSRNTTNCKPATCGLFFCQTDIVQWCTKRPIALLRMMRGHCLCPPLRESRSVYDRRCAPYDSHLVTLELSETSTLRYTL
jgi:hypothetical protein